MHHQAFNNCTCKNSIETQKAFNIHLLAMNKGPLHHCTFPLLGPITAPIEHTLVLWKLVKKADFLKLVSTYCPNKVGMQVLITFLSNSSQFFWEKHQHTLALIRWLWNGQICTSLCQEAQVIHTETSQGHGLSKQSCRWGHWGTASKASHKLLILVV